jgi:hypothetical protein
VSVELRVEQDALVDSPLQLEVDASEEALCSRIPGARESEYAPHAEGGEGVFDHAADRSSGVSASLTGACEAEADLALQRIF